MTDHEIFFRTLSSILMSGGQARRKPSILNNRKTSRAGLRSRMKMDWQPSAMTRNRVAVVILVAMAMKRICAIVRDEEIL